LYPKTAELTIPARWQAHVPAFNLFNVRTAPLRHASGLACSTYHIYTPCAVQPLMSGPCAGVHRRNLLRHVPRVAAMPAATDTTRAGLAATPGVAAERDPETQGFKFQQTMLRIKDPKARLSTPAANAMAP
jgi:hypothetical protein